LIGTLSHFDFYIINFAPFILFDRRGYGATALIYPKHFKIKTKFYFNLFEQNK